MTRDDVNVTINMVLTIRVMGDEERGEDPKVSECIRRPVGVDALLCVLLQLVKVFCDKMKPDNLTKQLRDAQAEAVRGLSRSVTHTEVYGLRGGGLHSDDPPGPSGAEEEKAPDGRGELRFFGCCRGCCYCCCSCSCSVHVPIH